MPSAIIRVAHARVIPMLTEISAVIVDIHIMNIIASMRYNYTSPTAKCMRLELDGSFLASSSTHAATPTQKTPVQNDDEEKEHASTINPRDNGWHEDADEEVLLSHENCKIMANGGIELGEAFGKVHFLAKEASPQAFICCVTSKRLVLIPQESKKVIKTILTITGTVLSINPLAKRLAINQMLEQYVDYPIGFPRTEMLGADISEDYPDGTILIVHMKGYDLFLGFPTMEYTLNVHGAINFPHFFAE